MILSGLPRPIKESGFGNSIKSRQSGVVTLTNTGATVPISPVGLAKAIVRISYVETGASNTSDFFLLARFTSNSQISIECDSTNTVTKDVSWEVIEFNNAKIIQSGQVTNTVAATGLFSVTATVSAVNTGKSLLFFSSRTTNQSTALGTGYARGEVTNSNTLTFWKYYNTMGGVDTFQYYLVEFF